MSQPVWTRMGFTLAVALGLLALSAISLYAAAFYAWSPTVAPAKRFPPNAPLAVVLFVIAMLLVIAAIVVPLIIRRKSQARLKSSRQR